MTQEDYKYILYVDGWPVAAFRHYGDANLAAMDAAPHFSALDAAACIFDRFGKFRLNYTYTQVLVHGDILVGYVVRQGKLARFADDEESNK